MPSVHIALDLEFTGLDPVRDEIIEVGAVKFQGSRELERFQTLVHPTIPLPLQTERLTGIRRVDLDRAPRFDDVRDPLRQFIGDAPIVGQSAPRDLDVLAKQGLTLPNPVYDTFDLASILMPELDSYSLTAIAEKLKVQVTNAHRALADAMTTKEVFLRLSERAERLDPRTIAEIVQLTSMTEWPLKRFFQDIEREQNRRQAPATSLGALLAAKGQLDITNVDFLTRAPDRLPPLQPEIIEERVDLASVSLTLEPGGPVAKTLPEYEHRLEQIEMLEQVGNALEIGEHLLVEAGTGTGKSLAYLLPAAELARKTNQHVVISTNTINLQEQIVAKDIPRVAEVLRVMDEERNEDNGPIRTAVVKGRTNYLCLRRWSDLRRAGIGLSLDEVKVLCRILVWLPETTSGDRAELNLGPGEQAVWSKVSAQADDCLVGTCTFQKRGTCFLYRARRAAESAHLVVVNHALLLSDLASNSRILPEYDHLVIDEAHHLEDEATRQFGFSVAKRDVLRHLDGLAEQRARDRWTGVLIDARAYLRDPSIPKSIQDGVGKLLTDVSDNVTSCRPVLDSLFEVLAAFSKQTNEDNDQRRRLTAGVRHTSAWEAVEVAWDELQQRLYAIGEGLVRLQAMVQPFAQAKIEDFDNFLLELTAQVRRNNELRGQLQNVIAAPDENSVTWLDSPANGQHSLCAAPLEVGTWLHDGLFADKRSVILTSATLTAGGSFEYARERLGLSDVRELQVGSPFDYKKNSLVFVPSNPDFPEPNRPGHDAAIANALNAMALASGGRMLALFTSNSALRRARSAMRSALERKGILVLGQNVDGPRGQLLNTLRNNPRTVLLGTSSFWEGVDVAGDALSVLVITKLPFGVPSDPVFAARSERFEDAFNQFAVPQAILRFRQGFGRLIRTTTDRGVTVVLDTRIRTKGYGAAFRRSMPTEIEQLPIEEIPGRIASFLQPAAAAR